MSNRLKATKTINENGVTNFIRDAIFDFRESLKNTFMNRYAHIIQHFGGRYFGANRGELPNHLSPEQLNEVEQQLNYLLPIDYREFLREYGGYNLQHSAYFPIQSSKAETGFISHFFGVGNELLSHYQNACDSEWPLDEFNGLYFIRSIDEWDIEYDEQAGIKWVTWPTEILPIAGSSGHAEICLVLAGDRTGSVIYWVSNPASLEPDVYLVANSFDEFMKSLYRKTHNN